MHFTYFVESTRDAAEVAAGPLAYAFDGDPPQTRGCDRGPGGKPGVTLAHPTREETGYFPDCQDWQPIPGEEGLWIGHDKAKLPGPADLAREVQTGRYTVPLGDGRRWLVPTALTPDEAGKPGESPLPKVRRIDEAGKVQRRVKPEYEALQLAADEVWEAAEQASDLPEERAWEICVLALQTNYRLAAVETSILGLVDDDAAIIIPACLVDLPAWPKFQKTA